MTDRNIKYDYFEFKKLHEEHNGNISRLSMILSKERPTIRNWIVKMKRDDDLIAEHAKDYMEKDAVDLMVDMFLKDEEELIKAIDLATETIKKNNEERVLLKSALCSMFISLDYTDKQKADIIGVSTSVISKMNKYNLSIRTVNKIIDYLISEYTAPSEKQNTKELVSTAIAVNDMPDEELVSTIDIDTLSNKDLVDAAMDKGEFDIAHFGALHLENLLDIKSMEIQKFYRSECVTGISKTNISKIKKYLKK